MADELWGVGFTLSLVLSVVLIVVGTVIPSPSGYNYYVTNIAYYTTTFSKSVFLVLTFYLATLILYGFSDKSFFSGLLDGASTVLTLSNYIAVILVGYRVDFVLPFLMGVSMGKGQAIIVDWSQIAITTIIVKYRGKIVDALRRGREGGAAAGI